MNVLDPFEVAEIEIWPLFELQTVKKKDGNKITPEYLSAIARLNSTEYTVFQKVINRSSFKAVLNEKDVQETNPTGLPCSHRARIIPKGLYEARKHPDVRIARRASTIASGSLLRKC
jgi:hypothetical protein